LPIRSTLEQTQQALSKGALELQSLAGSKTVVFAVIGDMMLLPVYEAAQQLAAQGIGSKIVAIISPRRLYRPSDVAWAACSQPDDQFLEDEAFVRMFGGDALIGVTGGSSAMLEPVMLRSALPRDLFAWKRGETTASAAQLMAMNGLTANNLTQRAMALLA
jgi:phosphoketolase